MEELAIMIMNVLIRIVTRICVWAELKANLVLLTRIVIQCYLAEDSLYGHLQLHANTGANKVTCVNLTMIAVQLQHVGIRQRLMLQITLHIALQNIL